MLIGYRMAGEQVVERFLTSFKKTEDLDDSAMSRLRQWKACWQSIKEHPFGIGPRHWPYESVKLGLAQMEAHSHWLQTAAESGIPGLFFLLIFYGLCVWRLWPLARERGPPIDPQLRYQARMVIASLVGFGVSACFVTVPGIEAPYYIAMMGAGILKVYGQNQEAARHRR
jgi:O-antigen ligase